MTYSYKGLIGVLALTDAQGHFMGIFSSRFHSFGQLWKFNSDQWALEYTRAVLFGAGLVWLLPVANNATQHGLSDNSNEYLIQIFVLIFTRFNPTFVPTSIVANITSTHIERIDFNGDSLPKFRSENLTDSRAMAEALVYICFETIFLLFSSLASSRVCSFVSHTFRILRMALHNVDKIRRKYLNGIAYSLACL